MEELELLKDETFRFVVGLSLFSCMALLVGCLAVMYGLISQVFYELYKKFKK